MDMHQQIRADLPELLEAQRWANDQKAEFGIAPYVPFYRLSFSVTVGLINICLFEAGSSVRDSMVKARLCTLFSYLLSENLQACIRKGVPIEKQPAQLEFLASSYSRSHTGFVNPTRLAALLDDFLASCAAHKHISVHKFFGLCDCLGFRWQELRRMYLDEVKNGRLSHVA